MELMTTMSRMNSRPLPYVKMRRSATIHSRSVTNSCRKLRRHPLPLLAGGRFGVRPPWVGVESGFARLGRELRRHRLPLLAGGRFGVRPPWVGVDPGFVRLGWGSIWGSTGVEGGGGGVVVAHWVAEDRRL